MSSNAIDKGKSMSVPHSTKAGLEFPVGRVAKKIKAGEYSDRLSAGTPVHMTAVLEYLSAEILELAGNAVRVSKRRRIVPRDIQMAITNDEELNKLFDGVTIASGGANPKFNQTPPPKSTGGREK